MPSQERGHGNYAKTWSACHRWEFLDMYQLDVRLCKQGRNGNAKSFIIPPQILLQGGLDLGFRSSLADIRQTMLT